MAKGRSSIAIKAANPGKKYDRMPLACHNKDCDNDFYVANTNHKRECFTCFDNKINKRNNPKESKRAASDRKILQALGMLG